MSIFQKEREQKFEEDLEKLIITQTGFKPSQKNYEIAHKYASSNLKFHKFPDPNAHQIQNRFDGIIFKLQKTNKLDTADFLNKLFQAVKKLPLKQDYPDMPYRIIDLLLYLSSNLIEHNLDREPNKKVLEPKNEDQISISSIDSLKDWKYETSSESEQEEYQQEERKIDNQKQILENSKQIEEQQQQNEKPNVLWHISKNEKKSFHEFLNSINNNNETIKSQLLFQAEYQNKALEIIKDNKIIHMVTSEKDVVVAIIYILQGQQSDLIINQQGQFILNDFDIHHMTHEALLQCTQTFLNFASIIHYLRKPLQMIQKPSLFNIEMLVQEQFWIGIRSILYEFDQLLVELLYLKQSITLMVLGQKLSTWRLILQQVYLVAQNISQIQLNQSVFSSPTLTILYNVCMQNSLQPQTYQIYIQRLFLYSLDPYLTLLNKYLDYNSIVCFDTFEQIPIFLQNCVIQLKNIGQAFQIFQKVGLPALKQIKFKENFIIKLCQLTNTNSIKTQIIKNQQQQQYILSGKFKLHDPFTILKLQKQEQQMIETEYYSVKNINNPDLIKIFQKEIVRSIKQEDQTIQNILLNYLNEQLQFLKIHKYLRCLFFFQRVDLMISFIEQIAEYQSLAKLKNIQNTIQDNLNKYLPLKFDINPTLFCQTNQLFQLSHKSVMFKINLPHPIDLIINDNAIILYNKIMQFLLIFKNSKLHLSRAQLNLKKNINKKLWKLLQFSNELMNFMTNYEYFLFISIIQVQTVKFENQLKLLTNFTDIINHHTIYLKTISDKMFLNQKSESILDAIYKIIDIVQNYPTLIERTFTLDIIDIVSRNLENMRIESEFQKMKESFTQQINALILLFDNYTQRFTHSPEIIECILKVNFNMFYK